MDTVIVEFNVGPENAHECVAALQDLTDELVSRQQKYHGHTILIEHQTGKVCNVMLWDEAADFVAFRDANRAAIGAAIGHFGPKPRFFSVARAFKAPDHGARVSS